MVKDNLISRKKLQIFPVYFFYGSENYLIEEEIQRLLRQTLSEKEKGLNFHLFSVEEHNIQEIIQTAQTLPMFSRYRFVLVSGVNEMDEEKVKSLMGYIRNPSESTCFVLQGKTIGPWKAFRREVEKTGQVREYPRLRGKVLISWVRKRMEEKGKPLSEEAAGYLIEVVGDHLYDIDNALEKVFLSVGEKRRVELSDVEEISSDVKISTVFDLTDAIGHQNLEKALGILEKTMESGAISFKKEEEPSKKDKKDPVPLLLGMMAKQYWNILMIKKLSSLYREEGELAKELGTSPWYVKKMMEQGRNFSEASLQEGIQRCHETDLAVKRSRGPKDLLMEKLVIDLCRPRWLG